MLRQIREKMEQRVMGIPSEGAVPGRLPRKRARPGAVPSWHRASTQLEVV